MIAGIAEADRALDLAITGIATALDEDDDDATDANTMASLMPVIPVPTPTMEAFMLVLQSLQTQNHAILTRLDSMDDTNKQRHGELCAEITSKADSTDITCLDHQLADVNNQLSSAVVDIKANLTHVTKTHAAELKKLDEMIVTQHACLDSYSTSLDDRFAALERRLSHSTPRTTVVDPSLRGCNSSTSQFPSAVLPEGSVDNTPGPDDSADANDDDVDIDGTVPMP
jgi:hypothetical protein